MAAPKNIEIIIELGKKVPKIKADKDKIKQIFYNLINNAVKFSKEKGKIMIKVLENSKNIQIDVSDRGIGIANEDFKKIFEKFQQVDSKMTRKAGGTGLGLAIIKNLIKVHGGEIWVNSQIGKGSTFSFTLKK